MIGYALCGSFCTHAKSLEVLEKITKGGIDVLPIVSDTVYSTSTRFGTADALLSKLRELCGKEVIHTIKDAEPLGPRVQLEALIIAPCTGNTLAKIANGVCDTPVTMAAKAHLRGDRPLVISLASNDALAGNLVNIGKLLVRKNIFFVPMTQDDPAAKPHSLVADMNLLPETLSAALRHKQLRPLFR